MTRRAPHPQAPRVRGPRLRGAFTFIELLIVVMIVGILAAAAAPRYGAALNSFRADAAASRVAADIRMVQQHARKTSTVQTVEFDIAMHSYEAPDLPPPSRRAGVYQVNLQALYAADVTAADFDGVVTLTLGIEGRPIGAGAIAIQVGSDARQITIDEAGHVAVITL